MLVLLNAESQSVSWLAYADLFLLLLVLFLVAPASVVFWRDVIFKHKVKNGKHSQPSSPTFGCETSEIRNCWFRFECSKRWVELTETNDPGTRFCSQCEKTVHWCDTAEELQDAIRHNLCVAIKVQEASTDVPPTERLGDPFAFLPTKR